MGFSDFNRIWIRARDNGMCQWPECENKGQEASHIYHGIDDPDFGELLCKEHHLTYHRIHVGKAALIGLTELDNINAVKSIQKRLYK
jgi:hypothetical protein